MTNPLPPVVFDAVPVPASGYGLYSAATIIDTGEVARILGGVTLRPYNCDTGFGTYSTDLCTPGTPAEKDPGVRGIPDDNPAQVVWGAADCASDATESEEMARARHTRTLHEPLLVESAFATRMLTDAGPPSSAPDFVTAVGMLEEFLGEQGYQGYIHAARRWAGLASQYRWSNQTSPLRRSPLEHGYVFGGGYSDTLGDTLVATGPLYIWRSEPFEQVVTTGSHVQGRFNNSVYAVSERVVAVGYECAIMAVTITPPV